MDEQYGGTLRHHYAAVFEVTKEGRKLSRAAVQQYRVSHRIRSAHATSPHDRRSQILFVHGNHWLVVSNDHKGPANEVRVYDTMKFHPDRDFRHQVAAVFGFEEDSFTIQAFPVQRQSDDLCGFFSLAFLQAIGRHMDPTELTFSEKVLVLANLHYSQSFKPFGDLWFLGYATVFVVQPGKRLA